MVGSWEIDDVREREPNGSVDNFVRLSEALSPELDCLRDVEEEGNPCDTVCTCERVAV